MKIFNILFLLYSILPCFLYSTDAVDTLTASQSMKDGDTLVSSGGSFEMGFFSPGSSPNRYVGIWYNNIPAFTVVWVANRQVPITNKLAILKLNVHPPAGFLVLADSTNNSNTIWSLPPTNISRPVRNPILQLLDTGNLVVREEDDLNPDNFYWQSFDYPTDTILPHMKLGKNFETGLERYLTSWKSKDDPAPGDYTFHCDPTGYPQLVLRNKSVEYFRLGSWNGLHFSGLIASKVPANNNFTYEVVINEKESYYIFDIGNKSSLSRLTMSIDGIAERWWLLSGEKSWTLYLSVPTDPCDAYSHCGVYGTCNVICQCLDKFVPQNQSEWDINVWSKGCRRRVNLDCTKGDGFRKYYDLKWPDTKSSWYNKSMTLDECKARCLQDCSCMAYATLDARTGAGCLIWLGDLIDMKELTANYQDIYVRMASADSDLTDMQYNSKRKKGANLKVILPIIFSGMVVIMLSLTLFSYARKKKNARPVQEGGSTHDNGQNDNTQRHREDLELPLFDLAQIHNATSSFSLSNKLGEGGFGPVYKGVLENGEEIAVKRLSKTSNQGLDEFKNEVIYVSKLQHRNLVKLLGCCIQGDEKLLIYEFMPNKSLDSFLFDETQSSLLGWTNRFHIINGIARGLLYLHQDSRLRIIHRDLKASNVLLDYDMNPKISDFGVARSFGGNETQARTQRVVGTYGYMSPEYAVDGIFSTKSDVFSFGVLVLEIISGKRNRGFIHQDHHHNLLGHVWRLFNEGRSLEVIEEVANESCHLSEVLRAIQVGLLCVQESPEDRPSMSSVVLMLASDGTLPRPKQPGFYTERNITEVEFSSSIKPTSSVCELTMTLIDGR